MRGMKWTQGKDLLNPPYSKTPAEIFEAATEGVIVPRIPCQPTLYPDPGEHNETRRLLPTHEFDKAYDEPGHLRFQRGWLKRWLSKTDGENQREEAERRRDGECYSFSEIKFQMA